MRKQNSSCPLTIIVLGGSTRAGDHHQVLQSLDWPNAVALDFSLHRSLHDLARVVERHARHDGLVAFVSDELEIQHPEWAWQALGLTELHSDVAIVGGRISRPDGTVMDAGRYFGYGRGCDCPDRGRQINDPGYHAQFFKQRSVDAVPLQFCMIKAKFLGRLLAARRLRKNATLFNLAAWAGAAARRRNLRVVYSPFLAATMSEDWNLRVSEEDLREFVRHNADVLGESRYYPAHLDASGDRPYREATRSQREQHLANICRLSGIEPDRRNQATGGQLGVFSDSAAN
jgi:hypothetical protein